MTTDPVTDLDLMNTGPLCPICGSELDWEDCTSIHCDDGLVDLAETEPDLYLLPGAFEPCEECLGKGGWWWCPNAGKHPKEQDRPC